MFPSFFCVDLSYFSTSFYNGSLDNLISIIAFLVQKKNKLMKGKALKKQSLHEKTAASVLLKNQRRTAVSTSYCVVVTNHNGALQATLNAIVY